MSSSTVDKPFGDKVLMISSDGHVTAPAMEDYREYMPSKHHEEFDAFCKVLAKDTAASTSSGRGSMSLKYDPELVDLWERNVTDQGRLEGTGNPSARLEEHRRAGLAGEVLFPDFGLPFEKYPPFQASTLGYTRTREQVDIANKAYNRWLLDFISIAPHRFAALALTSFDDIDAAIAEIHWAKDAGFKGVLLPMFREEEPIFHPRFQRIWDTVVDLEMPLNSHVAVSGVTEHVPKVLPTVRNATVSRKIYGSPLFFYCHELFNHMVWGGIFDANPDMQVVFTEQGSGWVIGALAEMDYTWSGSMLKRDMRDVVRVTPSEYFHRQCHLGSSIFSLAEVQARHQIGIDKMTLGMDYPHPEGTWGMGPGHLAYLQATVGAAEVPGDEARLILGENAVKLWGFDTDALAPTVLEQGFTLSQILTKPERDEFPRGDVHKPLSSVLAG